ncbi:MAG: hypothetical protein DI623_14780 [Sphingomonas sanxanigenens]|uniref:Uncharacterized protein n=1 Tax=Sphingomonas sanxanigenens TaxID=397260 RepID=A0A2W5BWE8_9SPHN|nr:MAG: hypothetical protein DI623_14780 [Sphingomonas sanxanigenens]
MIGAQEAAATHDFVCVDCDAIERRASAIHVPRGWRRTDEGMICADCAQGAPKRLAEACDRDLIDAMADEAASATGLAAPIATHLATGILLGFRLGAPMEARGMALIGLDDARLVVRQALSQSLAAPAAGAVTQ